jgi:copper resistance protein C
VAALIRSLVALAVVVAVVALVAASPAQAHTELEASTPADGARLREAPSGLGLRFTEDISAEFAQVSLSRGQEPPRRLETSVAGPTVTAPVPPASAAEESGRVTWEVAYRVVSADGHPITGTVTFTAPAGAPPPSSPSPSSAAGAGSEDASAAQSEGSPEAGAGTAGSESSESSGGLVTVVGVAAAALLVTAGALVFAARRRARSSSQ